MKFSIKSMFLIFLIIILSLISNNCKVILRDHQSPCTPGVYYDSTVCEQWKEKFPGEFKAYQKRIDKNN